MRNQQLKSMPRKFQTKNILGITLLVLTLSSCSKSGMFGGFGISIGGGGSKSIDLETYNLTAANSTLYPDLELKINNSNNTILRYLNSLVDVSTLSADQKAMLNDYGLNYDNSCVTLSENQFTCELSNKDLQSAILSENNIVQDSAGNFKKMAAGSGGSLGKSYELLVAPKSAQYTLRKNILDAFKAKEAEGIKIDSANFATEVPLCLDESAQPRTECQFLTMEVSVNGEPAVYRVYEHLSLRDKNFQELKDYIKFDLANTSELSDVIKVDQELVKELLKKKVRREFLQVNANALLAHGVNLFSVFSYLGMDVTTADTNNTLEKLNFNKNSLSSIYTDKVNKVIERDFLVSNVLNKNKPAFYYFVEKFITEDDVYAVEGSPNLFEYKINVPNLCRYLETSGVTSGCAETVRNYVSRLKIIHDINKKRMGVSYVDAPYVPTALEAIYLEYDYKYNAAIKGELANLRQIAIGFLQKELDTAPVTAQNNKIDSGDIDFLNSMTMSGIVGLYDSLEISSQGLRSDGIADIEETTLASHLGFSFFSDFHLNIPENLDPTNKKFDVGFSDSSEPMKGSSEGDVVFQIPRTLNFVSLSHSRDASLYDDVISLYAPKVDLKFPPYQLSATDLFSFKGRLNQNCELANDEVNVGSYIRPSNCDAQFKLSKEAVNNSSAMAYGVARHYASDRVNFDEYAVGLTPVDLKLFLPVDSTITATNQWNRKLDSYVVVTPYDAYVRYPAENSTHLGQTLSLAFPNYTSGEAEYYIHAPLGFLADKNYNLIPDENSIYKPISFDATLSLVRTDNGLTDVFSHCGIPMDFAASSGSISTAVSSVFTNIFNGTYNGQYACTN